MNRSWLAALPRLFTRQRVGPVPVVLMYHRVAAPEPDPWGLAIHPARFAEQLEILQHTRTVLPLDRFVTSLAGGRLPRDAVAVTFDDGYADNLHAAQPLLERHDVPATLFLATGCLDGTQEFWWDELERVVLLGPARPDKVHLTLAGQVHRWIVEKAQSSPAPSGWRAWDPPPSPRHAAYAAIWRLLRGEPAAIQRQALNSLAAQFEAAPGTRASHRPMTVDEVAALGSGPITLGAHTVTHPALSGLEPGSCEAEISGSARRCAEIAGRQVRFFSYPYGDLDDGTAELVGKLGFAAAFTTEAAGIPERSDRLRLPRIQVPDLGGDEFEHWLDGLGRFGSAAA